MTTEANDTPTNATEGRTGPTVKWLESLYWDARKRYDDDLIDTYKMLSESLRAKAIDAEVIELRALLASAEANANDLGPRLVAAQAEIASLKIAVEGLEDTVLTEQAEVVRLWNHIEFCETCGECRDRPQSILKDAPKE